MSTGNQDDLFVGAVGDDVALLDPREVNREISAQLATERRASRLRKISAGTHTSLLRDACRRHANDPHKQLNYFLQKGALPAATGRQREVSEKTRTDFGETLHRAFHELREERCPIKSLSEFGRSHGVALVSRWVRQGNGPATIQTKVSFLRRFLTLVGKPNAIPKGREWTQILTEGGIDCAEMRRVKVLASSKTWESKGIDPFEVFRRVEQLCPVVALQLEMQLAFGLRIKESFFIEPTVGDLGNKLYIGSGSKGGRPRPVDFDPDPQTSEWQRDLLERAKVLARKHPQRRLALRGKTLKQMRNRFNYLVTKAGISGAELGVTSHGLRHQYAARRFAALAGLPAPVAGSVPVGDYVTRADDVRSARLDVSQQLGHWREDVTSAYLGSVPSMAREARRRIDGWLTQLQGNAQAVSAFRGARVTEAWITGRAGMGLALRPTERLQLFVRLEGVPPSEGDGSSRIAPLQHALDLALEFDTAVLPWTLAGPPDDAVEVLFDRKPLRATGGEPHVA